ncbi:MAG: ABC transporter ATP-binding protein [Burkholderiales bacterium]|nr:ABC transporter ATP-binding protein [Burkholderiales bacterium]
MAGLGLEGVWKRYGGTVAAVKDLTLACPEGEMLAVLGPSGCGKSSTLKMIAGIETVSEGAIRFDATIVNDLDSAQRNVAMVFEDYALYSHLSVFENVAFPLRVRGMGATAVRERVDAVIEMLQLDVLRDASVRNLSGGAQQRVSIGRALVREPALVLFDEPLSHLDADQKAQLRTEIRRLQQTAGLTSILVTHDQTEALSMADRIAVMNHGVLQQVDAPEKIYDEPANIFVAGFIGEPAMNLLPCTLVTQGGAALAQFANGASVALGARGARIASVGGTGAAGILGVRPEDVRVVVAGSDLSGLAGRIVIREPRGDTDVLVVECDAGAVTVELAGPTDWRAGDPVRIDLPTDHLHFFDAQTGRNLARADP